MSLFRSTAQNPLRIFAISVAMTALLGACTNSNMPKAKSSGSSTTGGTSVAPTPVPVVNYTITNAVAAVIPNTTNYNLTMNFNAADPTKTISTVCSLPAGGKACKCEFTWTQSNVAGNVAVNVNRKVTSDVTTIQPFLAICQTPSVYGTPEVPTGTTFKVRVIPAPSSGESFTTNLRTFTKNPGGVVAGTFQDAEGRAFDDILHYSCFDSSGNIGRIVSKAATSPIQNATNPDLSIFPLMATGVCIPGVTAPGEPGCERMEIPQASVESYYYNLYIRNTAKGTINAENLRYRCPKVKEVLSNAGGAGSNGDFYPLDRNFALALNPSGSFTVPVEAASKVSNANDPTSVGSACYAAAGAGAGGAADSTSLISSCLGFAAKLNTDGSCPSINVNGVTRLTYRLRRYLAMYPPHFQGDGKMRAEFQSKDVVFVLDRPVGYVGAGADPMKPFTMLGPKPCPFAYFDRQGVVTAEPAAYAAAYSGDPTQKVYPGYVATSNPGLTGVNIDGVEFPNTDSNPYDARPMCSAALPLYNTNTGWWSIGTVHASNPVLKRVFIRPGEAWTPHYEEDTDFKACAPQPSVMKDPPLHFSKNPSTGNVAYCAMSYPSQNPNLTNPVLEPTYRFGGVIPYTSPFSYNSISSVCTATVPNLPATGLNVYGQDPTAPGNTGGAGCAGSTCGGWARHKNLPVFEIARVPNNGTCGGGADTATVPGQCIYYAHQTCDRTVTGTNPLVTYPLVARPNQIEAALASDSSYECRVTYDNGKGKAGLTTPTQGCCGSTVSVWTGTSGSANRLNRGAHLEPSSDPIVPTLCQQPTY